MSVARTITNAERRARVVARHHLGGTAPGVLEAIRSVAAMHSSDPVTPFLGVRARVRGAGVDALERALYEDRSLIRMHAMRRTLFVVPSAEVPVFSAAAADEIAVGERRRLETWIAATVGADRAPSLLADAEAAILELLADGREWGTRELAAAAPVLATPVMVGSGKWTTEQPLGSRLVLVLAMEGRIVRTRPAGSWRSSQYRWAATAAWLGERPQAMAPGEARTELARRYLDTHGPATLMDIRWWTGWTAKQASAALAALRAVPVALEGGGEGYLLPDDDAPVDPPPPTVAFLPGLDPTPMGWKERDWFLGEHGALLYDRNGNAGPTIWLDGRIVGGWSQTPDGEVIYGLLEDIGKEAEERVAGEAAELTRWLGGTVIATRFPGPLERALGGRAKAAHQG